MCGSGRTIKDLALAARSYRRFKEDEKVSRDSLVGLVELARISGSAANLQPLKYIISNDSEMNSRIFPTLAWAGYLKDWGGPKEGERPSAYIIILGDKTISQGFGCDHGIASQNIMLGAAEMGLGGCLIGSVKREELAGILGISENLDVLLVVALGWPAERVILEQTGSDNSIRYYRDLEDAHHVPKRPLDEVLVKSFGY